MKKGRQPKQKSNRYLNEYAEYESSRVDLRKIQPHLQRIPSESSVIYVKTYPNCDNIPVIDLTKSSHSILYTAMNSKSFPSSTSLKLIYKSKNFTNRINRPYSSSLLALPFKKSVESCTNNKSLTNLTKCSKERLAILDIPPAYFDEDTDGSEYAFHDLSKADLNEEDKTIVDSVVNREDVHDPAYSLETKQPIENMCKMYGVGSGDRFD
ncbi:uncharacterized protein LOC115886384 isoform X2 [Sitophilus oryzae]|nr:uncharacterized protein LOC115886384 isoform X2 [Sitophilus oryzae]